MAIVGGRRMRVVATSDEVDAEESLVATEDAQPAS